MVCVCGFHALVNGYLHVCRVSVFVYRCVSVRCCLACCVDVYVACLCVVSACDVYRVVCLCVVIDGVFRYVFDVT